MAHLAAISASQTVRARAIVLLTLAGMVLHLITQHDVFSVNLQVIGFRLVRTVPTR